MVSPPQSPRSPDRSAPSGLDAHAPPTTGRPVASEGAAPTVRASARSRARAARSCAAKSIPGRRSISTGFPCRQYEEACRIAGPLRPRCVNSSFSRNALPARTAALRCRDPRQAVIRSRSCPAKRERRERRTALHHASPNCRATSYPNGVAPIFGIENPPVAITSDRAAIAPLMVSNCERRRSPRHRAAGHDPHSRRGAFRLQHIARYRARDTVAEELPSVFS